MRLILFLSLVLLPAFLFGQKEYDLKRRHYGEYTGLIPAYRMDVGDEVVEVTATPIYINLEEDSITIKIGLNTLRGTYTVMFKADKYFLVDATMDGQLATERIIVYKWGKTISRDGLYPQPVAELNKVR